MCGLRHARGHLIVTMDDDLQNPPEEIPKLIESIEEGQFDLVYGKYEGKEHKPWRNLGSAVVNRFYRFVFRLNVTVTSFRVIRRELAESILSYDLNYTFLDGLFAWNTQRVGTTLVDHHPRKEGRSGYSLAKLTTLAMNLLTNFSLIPLQVVSLIGFLAAFIGFLMGVYYFTLSLVGAIAVPGYASVIVAVFVLGGLQLLALGVIGEYLGRMHLNINRKPQYTVRHICAGADRSVDDRANPYPGK